jgi:S-adenosylmethionine uptake transporter
VLQNKYIEQLHNEFFAKSLQAIIIVTLGWSCFAFADVISKWLTQSYSVSQVICLTSLAGAVYTGLWIIFRYGYKGFCSEKIKWHMLRGLCVTGTSFAVVHALSLIPLADFYSIVFLSPLVLALLSKFILGEHIGLHRALAIIIGFSGVLILAQPQFQDFNNGFLFALAGVFFIAGNGIIIRKISHEPITSLYAFYPFIFAAIINAPLMAYDMKAISLVDLPLILALPVFLVGGLVGFSLGFSKAPVTAIVAPFHYTQIIWGILFGYFLFGDIPTSATLLGASIIILAGLYLIWREYVSANKSP